MSKEVAANHNLEQDLDRLSVDVARSPIDKTWSLYLIETRTGSLYCGITLDVERRFAEHQGQSHKTARFLRGKGPLTLRFQTEVGNHSDALKIELQVKKLTRAKKESLIAGNIELLAHLGLAIPDLS